MPSSAATYLTALQLALPRAENGDAAAQTLIATIYADGLGVRQNLATASSWYALASDNGDVLATFELAMLYQDGRGVPQDRAARRRAFRQGRRHGQHAGQVQSRRCSTSKAATSSPTSPRPRP